MEIKKTPFSNFDGIYENIRPKAANNTLRAGDDVNETTLIKTRMKEVLYNSMAQAVLNVMATPYLILKLLLTICILFTVSISAFLVVKSVMAYYSYDVITKSRTINEMPSIFPKITFCNNNPFQTKYAVEYLKKVAQENEIDISSFFLNESNSFHQGNVSSKLDTSDYLYELAIIKMNSLNDTEKRMLSHNLSDLLIDCKFNGVNCSKEDFTWTFHRYRGIFVIF